MEVSGQLHATAALSPGKEPLVPIRYQRLSSLSSFALVFLLFSASSIRLSFPSFRAHLLPNVRFDVILYVTLSLKTWVRFPVGVGIFFSSRHGVQTGSVAYPAT
jgi:hypothetical protein